MGPAAGDVLPPLQGSTRMARLGFVNKVLVQNSQDVKAAHQLPRRSCGTLN
jgi:hypothetical protein